AGAARAAKGVRSRGPRTGPIPSPVPRKSTVSHVWLHSVNGNEAAGSLAASASEGSTATTNQAVL
ncbi:hypothetical protein ACKI18_47195, partial [Streptomyces niveiscabiei]